MIRPRRTLALKPEHRQTGGSDAKTSQDQLDKCAKLHLLGGEGVYVSVCKVVLHPPQVDSLGVNELELLELSQEGDRLTNSPVTGDNDCCSNWVEFGTDVL